MKHSPPLSQDAYNPAQETEITPMKTEITSVEYVKTHLNCAKLLNFLHVVKCKCSSNLEKGLVMADLWGKASGRGGRNMNGHLGEGEHVR